MAISTTYTVEISLSLGELANLTSVQQVVQLLNLKSTNYSVLGGIEEVSIIWAFSQQWLIGDQDSEGELVGAKALWLAVITKVNVIYAVIMLFIVTKCHQSQYQWLHSVGSEHRGWLQQLLSWCQRGGRTKISRIVAAGSPFQFLRQVRDQVIGSTFTGGVTAVVSLYELSH